MSILSKYMVKNHSYFLLITLGIGVGIFVIIDLIERADYFLAIEGGASFIIPFYFAKLPGIISQILPAVFLLASVILLCVMIASREVVALHAGGISVFVLARTLLFCGIFWAIVQFLCSQLFVIQGEEMAQRIWQEDIRNKVVAEKSINDVWFKEQKYIIYLGTILQSGKGEKLIAYKFSEDESRINTIIRAEDFVAKKGGWSLTNVEIIHPDLFDNTFIPLATFPLEQSPNFFFVTNQGDPKDQTFFVLTDVIKRLEASGSNVEALKTRWYSKLAYSASIIVLAIVSVAIVTYKENIYLAVILSVVIAFIAYVATSLGDSLGESGALPPIVAAWGPQLLLCALAFARIQYVTVRR